MMSKIQHEGSVEIKVSNNTRVALLDLSNSDLYQLLISQNLQHISSLEGKASLSISLRLYPPLPETPSTFQIQKNIIINNMSIDVRIYMQYNPMKNLWLAKIPLLLNTSSAMHTPQISAKLLRIAVTDTTFAPGVNYHIVVISKIKYQTI